ncbi:hypothetical protein B0F90DRAFT_1666463 [Multifurca ochricompacta]|uniref:Uncharacterized protein n=1 Tax=Multifurca ochricompacta TaxID=376703 RepID=A0AAD4QQX9_9AGAM|nr:hypothetical protein B0F90DRAFT_1666463 [Multifurca ochricompacta]
MSQRDEKQHEEKLRPAQGQEDDYDIYLFWPSLSNRDVSSEGPPSSSSSPLYGPVSLYSESTDYYHPELDSGPPSPLTFAPAPDFRFPSPVQMPLDFGTAPVNEPQALEGGSPPRYSTIFKMGLFFSITHRFDRAIDGVKVKFRKPKSRAS